MLALELVFQTRNRLLAALSTEDLAVLAPHLSWAPLERSQTLEAANQPIRYCYFIESGIVSIVAKSKPDRHLEAGLVGPEGMTGLTVVMGDDRSPNDTFVQAAGSARRVASDRLQEALAGSVTLQRLLLHYAQAFMTQTAHTALASGTAKIEERLARWILMSHDRLGRDDLPLTHDVLAMTLGVRRAGVTDAVHQLEGRGLIRASRGQIRVVDRKALIVAANGSYGVPEAEYERLLG